MTVTTKTSKHLSRLAAGCAALAVIISLGIGALAQAEDAKKEDVKTEAAAAGAMTKADVEKIIEEYLMNNGKVIMDSVDNYQRKAVQERSEAGLKANYDNLYKDESLPYAGNKDGDVVVVEFFDYNCGYCKRVLPDVQKLIEADKNVKVVFVDFPILGPTSETAARWAMAAHKQDKYFAFHQAMMLHTGQIDDAALREVAKTAELDVEEAAKYADSSDVTMMIEKHRNLGKEVGVTGTPAFTIEHQLFPGAVPVSDLIKAVEEVRKNKKAE